MIRQLVETDRQEVLKFLSKEPSINLFIIGDIENYGFNDDKQRLWGEFDNAGNYMGVLLQFKNSFIPYYDTDIYPDDTYDISAFIEIAKAFEGTMIVSGKAPIVKRFYAVLDDFKLREQYFCELAKADDIPSQFKTLDTQIQVATTDDDERIYELIGSITEFSGASNVRGNYAEKISDGSGRVYYIEQDGKFVTVTQTAAESSSAAMVVGVATHADYRKKGYMSRCLAKLCMDLLADGKSLCLFYDNPKAGNVYHQLGFKTIGQWAMMTRKCD